MTSRLLKKPIGVVALDRLRVNVQEHAPLIDLRAPRLGIFLSSLQPEFFGNL